MKGWDVFRSLTYYDCIKTVQFILGDFTNALSNNQKWFWSLCCWKGNGKENWNWRNIRGFNKQNHNKPGPVSFWNWFCPRTADPLTSVSWFF